MPERVPYGERTGPPYLDPDSPTRRVLIPAPESLWEEIDAAAAERGEGRSEWVREACRQRLKRQGRRSGG